MPWLVSNRVRARAKNFGVRNMKKLDIKDTIKLSSPHLFGLLVSKNEEDKLNIMGVSWFCFASLKPPKMILCLSNKGYTGELIKQNGLATLCLPTERIKEKALCCCRCSGRDVDKLSKFGLTTILPDEFDVPAIEGAKIAWALKLEKTMLAGDHTVYQADIVAAAMLSDEKSLYAFDGYRDLKTI